MTAKSRRSVRLTESFPASAERVFDAWLSPDKVARWFLFDAGERVTRVEIDARVGGSIRVMTCRAGRVVEHTGEYLEIRRPHRLCFTIGKSASGKTARVTVHIEPRDDGCFLTLTSTAEPPPLRAHASFALLETSRSQKGVRSHWPSLEGKAALALGLHLAMVPVLLMALPRVWPEAGPPPVPSILTVDIGTTEGGMPAASTRAAAVAAPGETPRTASPATAPAPPVSAAPVPRIVPRMPLANPSKSMALLPPRSMRPLDSVVANQGTRINSPAFSALNSLGVPQDKIRGPDLTTSEGRAGGILDGGPSIRDRRGQCAGRATSHWNELRWDR